MDYTVGQLIISKAGRDKLKYFVIIEVAGEYVYLVDGALRRMEKPKKKKLRHVQPTRYIAETVRSKITEGRDILDSDIRKAIALFEEGKAEGGCCFVKE